MKTILVILVATVSASVGETVLSYAMRRIGRLNPSAKEWFLFVATNPYVYLGTLFLACFFFLYLLALSWADLSFVLPVTALSYLFAAILAKYFLGEHISWLRWSGIAIIVVGIALVVLEGDYRHSADLGP